MAQFTPARGLLHLQSLGWSPAAAAGILGNLQQESNFNPTAVHDGGSGFGMAGWRDSSPGQGRKTALIDYARKTGRDANDPFVQLDFLNQELRTTEGKTGSLLSTAKTPAEAATAFLGFERPAGWSPGGDPTQASGYANRVQYANAIAGGHGADTEAGGAGGDVISAAASNPVPVQPIGGNGMAGQGLLNQAPEVRGGLLGGGSFMEGAAPILGGIGDALIAAGAGNPNWGAAGSAGFDRGMQRTQQVRRQRAVQAMVKDNPQLSALLEIGGPEAVTRALMAQSTPQDVMNVGGRVYDPNTRQFVTPQSPDFQITQDANGNPIAVNKNDPTHFSAIGSPQPKQTDLGRNLNMLGIDPSALTPEQRLALVQRSGSTVNVNNAGETQFAKTSGEMQAKGFADLAGQLPQIGQRELQVSQLGGLLQSMPQGAGASSAAWLDSVGRTLGLSGGQLADKAQAVQAIANQIVPTLRMAGSGTMSDRDVELFKSTLPQLSNTPGANQAILSILSRSVAAQRQIGEIASKALSGEISPADAQKQIGSIQILNDTERQQLSALSSAGNGQGSAPATGGLRPAAGVAPQAISGMGMNDLSRLDPNTLTEEQRAAAEKRWDELSGGVNGGQ